MSRVRSIHPALWQDERFNSLTDNDRLTVIRAWSMSDGPGFFTIPGLFTTWGEIAAPLQAGLFMQVEHGVFCCRHLGRHGLPFPSARSIARHLEFWRRQRTAKTWAERGTGVTFAAWRAMRALVLRRDGYACRYCADTSGPIECDHVLAVANGGITDPSNLVAACRDCNRRKGRRLVQEWLQ